MIPQHPCRCETCSNEECPASQFNKFLVQFTGCLFHPLAREYLNKEVIEKLERLDYPSTILVTIPVKDMIKNLKGGVPK